MHKQTCTWGGQCSALAEYSCESCGPNTALCLEHMTGMHRTMNLTHVIKKWQRHVPVPHCAPFRLSRSLTIAPQAARACECDSTLDTPHSVVVLGLNGGDADVHYHCCQHPEHRAAWLVLYGYWPITPNNIKYAMPMTDFRLLTQVTHHITRLFLVCVCGICQYPTDSMRVLHVCRLMHHIMQLKIACPRLSAENIRAAITACALSIDPMTHTPRINSTKNFFTSAWIGAIAKCDGGGGAA